VPDLEAPLPKSLAPPPSGIPRSNAASPAPSINDPALDKKVQLWRTRLDRAQETLDRLGVALYTWRRGQDVIEEAVGIVQRAMRVKLEGKKGDR
jgi:ATP-dependent RNA helicase DDX27